MEKIFIKPAKPGLIVRHPEKLKHIIPPEGELVNYSSQWQRYIDEGSVIEVPAHTNKENIDKKPSKGGDK